jgi:hypothetical protein
MCVSPNLKAVAMCEVVRDDSKGGGSGGGGGGSAAAAAAGDSDSKLGDAGVAAKDDVGDKFETKAQVSVFHIATRRRMRSMSIPMKGGNPVIVVLHAACGCLAHLLTRVPLTAALQPGVRDALRRFLWRQQVPGDRWRLGR